MIDPEFLYVDHISCRAAGGAELWKCTIEAIVLAATEGKTVVFMHNEKDYTVNPVDLAKQILKQHETSN